MTAKQFVKNILPDSVLDIDTKIAPNLIGASHFKYSLRTSINFYMVRKKFMGEIIAKGSTSQKAWNNARLKLKNKTI